MPQHDNSHGILGHLTDHLHGRKVQMEVSVKNKTEKCYGLLQLILACSKSKQVFFITVRKFTGKSNGKNYSSVNVSIETFIAFKAV